MSSQKARWLLQALVAVAPGLFLLLPGLMGGIVGLPTAGIYGRIHAWWWISQEHPPALGFPGEAAAPTAEALAHLLAPLIASFGAVPLLKGSMLLDLLLCFGVTAWFLRGTRGWTRAAGIAVFSASPAVIAGLSSGTSEALRGWAALLPGLCSRPWMAPLGLVAGWMAPGFLPAALLLIGLQSSFEPGDWKERLRAVRWQILSGLLMAGGAAMVGFPSRVAPSATWFQKVLLPPEPTQVTTIYVGFSVVLALGLGWWGGRGPRRWAIAAMAAWGVAALKMPLVPAELLALVPLLAVVSAGQALGEKAPSWAPAGAVLIGAMILGEGWKGQGVPLETSSLEQPAAVLAVQKGPVLDLPATRGSAQRALYFQTIHHQRIAEDRDGMVPAQVDEAVKTLSGGGCPDLRQLGFTTVVARRELQFRELKGLVACLGTPKVDDGKVAMWELN